VLGCVHPRAELPGGFDDHIDAQLLPWQRRRVGLRQRPDDGTVDRDAVAGDLGVTGKRPEHRVVLE